MPVQLVANLGVNGFTTADLIRDELPALPGLAPEIATVLIGVNDVVQGVPLATYRSNAAEILDVLAAAMPTDRIVVIAVPDYTVTPAGGDYGDPEIQRAAIVDVNKAMAKLAAEQDMAFVDIFDVSRGAATDRSLVADDGLHPSGVQYRLWVDRIAPVFSHLLGGAGPA